MGKISDYYIVVGDVGVAGDGGFVFYKAIKQALSSRAVFSAGTSVFVDLD